MKTILTLPPKMPTPASSTPHWYVVYTRSRWEKKISDALTNKGIQNYCPLQKVHRQWKDRKKIIDIPVFTSYVFVLVDSLDKVRVLETDGVINYVRVQGKPAMIRPEEIQAIRLFLGEYQDVTVIDCPLTTGQRISVNAGIFTGREVEVVKVKGNKVQVIIQSLGIMLRAILPKNVFAKISATAAS